MTTPTATAATRPLLIIGGGAIARLAKFYFERDTPYRVAAFAVDAAFCHSDTFEGAPLLTIEAATAQFPPADCDAFVAIGYAQMNRVRAQKYEQMKQCGYRLATYISPHCTYLSQFETGDNCFILEDNTIQPFVRIGNNVYLWSGNHIGHDVHLADHVYVTSQVVIAGFTQVGAYSFLGVNATLRDSIVLGERTLAGAGAVLLKNTAAGSVWVPPPSVLLPKDSSELKI